MPNVKSIDLRQLRYFVGIVDAGSITRAAQILHVAQPALTNQMTALERSLGVKVLYRSTRGVVPTVEGEVLYRRAKRILHDLESVGDEVRSLGLTPAGSVRFACTLSSARMISTPLTAAVLNQLPHVHFSFIDGTSLDTYRRIQNDDADLAFLFKDGDTPGLTSHPLVLEELFVVVSAQAKRFSGRNEITVDEVSRLEFVMASAQKHFGSEFIHRRFAEASIRFRVVTEINSLAGLTELVLQNKAASILPWSGIHEYHENGQVRLLRVRGIDLSRCLALCRLNDRPLNPAVDAVSKITAGLVTSLVESGTWRFAQIYR